MDNYLDEKLTKEIQENLDETEKMLRPEDKPLKQHQCNFCDSMDTTEYSAEGEGSVWLCEYFRAIGSGESADR